MPKQSNAARREAVARCYDKRRAFINAWKAMEGCAVCGEDDPVVLDAHHKNPLTKHPKLKHGNNKALYKTGWVALRAELEGCGVLCANCHRREHADTRRSV